MERRRLTRTATVRRPLLQRACRCHDRSPGGTSPCSCPSRNDREEPSSASTGLLETAGVRDVLRTPGHALSRGSLSQLGPSVLAELPHVSSGIPADRLGDNVPIGPTDDAMEREARRVAARVAAPQPSLEPADASASFDLSRVRIHTDARAVSSADALGARAYTVGRHVVFGQGQYRPHTIEGGRLLAHELTHVAQQLGGAEPTTVRAQFYELGKRGLGEFAGGKNVPRRSLPRRRTQGPTMRREGTETVEGFPLRRAHCGCPSLIASELQGIEERIQAYEACARQPGMTIHWLQACVRQKIYGRQNVPAGGSADPESGTVDWPTPEQLERRAAALGQPAHGPCADLRNWGTLVRPAGSRSFEKEAAEYKRRTFQPTVDALKTTEVESYQKERRFYHEVREALARMCAPPPPGIKLIKSRRRPYRPRTTPQVDYTLEGP